LLLVAPACRSYSGASVQARLAFNRLCDDGWPAEFRPVGRDSSCTSSSHERSGTLLETYSALREVFRSVTEWDVVHVFVSSSGELLRLSIPMVFLARFSGKKIVIHLHSSHFGSRFQRWVKLTSGVLCQADAIVVHSQRLKDMVGSFGLRSRRMNCLIDAELFRYRRIEGVQPRILVVQSLEARNGTPAVVRAFGLVKQKYPRSELVVVGDGSQRDELERMVAGEQLHGVDFAGRVSRRRMAELFRSADLFVNAVSGAEVPPAMLEALASGLPIISVDGRAIREVITDGINGLLVDGRSHFKIADAIVSILETPGLAGKLSDSSRKEAQKHFWDNCRRDWVSLHSEIAGR
jgi:glycosyltransferase involved in cell wall biosynthesis